jgi:hypothetical protein
MINYLGTPTLFFTINLATVHYLAVSLLYGKEINLHVFFIIIYQIQKIAT